jgi:DNA-binding transcriptional LysR family regulator
MDTLQELRVFIGVAKAGSLSAAARELDISTAGVWRHINSLEDRMKVTLFHRTSRKASLTEAGLVFFEHAKSIVEQFETATYDVRSLGTQTRGALTIQANTAVGHEILAPALPGFLSKHPDIKIRLLITPELPDLVENDIDIAIRTGEQPNSATLVSRRLATIPRVLCASPSYLTKNKPITAPTDLLDHECLTYQLSSSPPVWSFSGPDGIFRVQVKGRFNSNTIEPLRQAMLAGFGLTVLPEIWLEHDLNKGDAQRVLGGWLVTNSDFDYNLYAVWQRRRHLSLSMRVMIDFLVETFRSRCRL